MKTKPKIPQPSHPGSVLADVLEDMNVSANSLAMNIRVPASRLTAILKQERSVTPDTALRLARYFGNTAEFWLNLQLHHDLARVRRDTEDRIEREVIPAAVRD